MLLCLITSFFRIVVLVKPAALRFKATARFRALLYIPRELCFLFVFLSRELLPSFELFFGLN